MYACNINSLLVELSGARPLRREVDAVSKPINDTLPGEGLTGLSQLALTPRDMGRLLGFILVFAVVAKIIHEFI